MKFRFCGGLDCPEWVLAGIALLSRLTSVKLKILVNQIIGYLSSGAIQRPKVDKLLADAKLSDEGDVKGCLSVLIFILESAAKNGCQSDDLRLELEQLGLPVEHSDTLCKAYALKADTLSTAAKQKSLKLPHLEQVQLAHTSTDDRVTLDLDMGILGGHEAVSISKQKLDLLISNLEEAKSVMEQYCDS